MNDGRFRSEENSAQTSRLSNYSGRHFDFLDKHHSVFSRNSYYHDMHTIHPWIRRPCSPFSGIPLTTLRTKSCSMHLEELSRPKIKRERMIRQEFFDNITNYAYSGVKATALTAQCSDRLAQLAKPKKRPNGSIDAVTLPKIVPDRGHLSDRGNDLAKPRHHTLLINSAWKNKEK